MAPLLRHSTGRSFPNDAVSSNDAGSARPATTTLVSQCGANHSDRSFLLIRERNIRGASGQRLVLRGIFDQALVARLQVSLSAVSRSDTPLTIDLRDVTFLDESCLKLLLRTQRSHSRVVFQVPTAGPVAQMMGARPERDLLGKARAFPPHVSAVGSDNAGVVLQA